LFALIKSSWFNRRKQNKTVVFTGKQRDRKLPAILEVNESMTYHDIEINESMTYHGIVQHRDQ